jgi:hypothetical protein
MTLVSATGTVDYPLARAVRVRLLGSFLAVLGLLVLVMTVVLAAVQPSSGVVAAAVVAVAVIVVTTGFALGRQWYVVRLDDTGYRVRFVRGVGRSQARWTEVEDLTTALAAGTECVVLRLRNGDASTVPVNLIEGDREAFVDELQRRLDAAHGYRRL